MCMCIRIWDMYAYIYIHISIVMCVYTHMYIYICACIFSLQKPRSTRIHFEGLRKPSKKGLVPEAQHVLGVQVRC